MHAAAKILVQPRQSCWPCRRPDFTVAAVRRAPLQATSELMVAAQTTAAPSHQPVTALNGSPAQWTPSRHVLWFGSGIAIFPPDPETPPPE